MLSCFKEDLGASKTVFYVEIKVKVKVNQFLRYYGSPFYTMYNTD